MSTVVYAQRRNRTLALGAFALSALAGQVLGQTVNEAEPNESKATATPVVLTTAGNGILGTINGVSTGSATSTTGSATADYFKITVPAATPGIYRYELQPFVSNKSLYTTSIRGLTVSSGLVQPGTDAQVQASAAPGNALPVSFELNSVFYAFGSSAQVYYRIAGSSSSTDPYEVDVVRSTVTPTVVPQTFNAGPITISTQATEQDPSTPQHTSFVVLDSNFTPVPTFQNDDATTAGGALSASDQSYCMRTLPAGTYYVAVGSGDYGGKARVTANQPAPNDDGNQDKPVLDFPGVVAAEYDLYITPPKLVNVFIADGCQTISVPAASPDAAGLAFIQFTVGTPNTPCVAISTSPSPLTAGMPGTFYATVTPGSPPNNAITSVTADLSAFGGSTAQLMYNDGVTGGDAVIDNIWTAQITLGNMSGALSFSATATDAGGRHVTKTANVFLPPPNDLCENAFVLSGLSGTPTSYIVNGVYLATQDGIMLECTSSNPDLRDTNNGIWYSYTPPTSCLLSLGGVQYMAVFDATPGCGNLGAPLVCDFNSGVSLSLNVPLIGGIPYLIYMCRDRFASTNPNDFYTPAFAVSFPVAPPNDLCETAIEVDLEDLPFIDAQSLAGANGDLYMNACFPANANGIWYHVTNGNTSCQMQMDQIGSISQSVIPTVFRGPCSALEEVYCKLTINPAHFVMEPNTGYYIHFSTADYASPNETFTVSFTGCSPTTHLPPLNDHCDQATVIPDGFYSSATPYTASQFIQTADRDTLDTSCRQYQDNSIWYTYTPSQPVRVLIKETSLTNATWALFSGTCGNLSFIACKTSDTSNGNTADLEPCVTYYICMYKESGSPLAEDTLNISLVTTQNGACQIGDTCTYVTSAANCAGTFMGAGSFCGNNNCCPADFNDVNGVTVQDIFDFLTAWLAGNTSANFNGVNGVTVQDIFDFLTAWLAGC